MENNEREKLFNDLRNVLNMGATYSGVAVSDKAINQALDGNCYIFKSLISIIAEHIKWWNECDINKAMYAQEVYGNFERFIKENENAENKG